MTTAKQNKQVSGSKPFTVRLTNSERSQLEHRAGAMPLGAYVKCVLFDDGNKQEHRGPRAPVQDRAAMASLLARMGFGFDLEHRLLSGRVRLLVRQGQPTLFLGPDDLRVFAVGRCQ